MRSRSWTAAAVLVPLVPGGLIAWHEVNEGLGVVLLLAAVAAACWIGGPVGSAAAAAGIVVVYARIRKARRGTERARAEAERRASALARRVELIGPILDAAP